MACVTWYQVRSGSESVAGASADAQANLDLSGRTEQQASALQQTASLDGGASGTVRHNADTAQQANAWRKSAEVASGRSSGAGGRQCRSFATQLGAWPTSLA